MTRSQRSAVRAGSEDRGIGEESETSTVGTFVRGLDAHLGARRRRPSPWVILILIALVGVGASVAVSGVFLSRGTAQPHVAGGIDPTGLHTVVRQDLSSQTQVSATLGYAGSYTVVNEDTGGISSTTGSAGTGSGTPGSTGTAGTFTQLPAVGEVVSQGQVLYRVDNSPVVLLYGSTPAYRSLTESGPASAVTGPDVQQLNADLVALGYVSSRELSSTSDDFGYWTKVGVEKLQAHLGVTQDGTLVLGQVLFLPTEARITAVSATLGGTAESGSTVAQATSTNRQVNIALDASEQSEVAVGDKVTITLPDGQTTPGVVSSVGTVATSGSASSSGNSGSNSSSSPTPTITVLVSPADPAATGSWDQAQVNVTVTTGSVSNVLVVPVNALLAEIGGGYAVEVVGAGGTHHLVPVTLGLFDDADGLVQVSGPGVAAGQRVVVPRL